MFKAKKKARVFGVPLAESTHLNRSSDSPVVASVVTDVMSYLEKHDFLTFEGLYRVPGRQSRLEALRDSYDKGKPIDFEAKMEDPFTCADLLLLYLRTLPEQLIPTSASGAFDVAVEPRPEEEMQHMLRTALFALPVHNRALLKLVCQHAARVVAAESANKMGLKNVTIVFVPSLYLSPKVFAVLVTQAEHVFTMPCTRCERGVVDAANVALVCDSCGQDGSTTEAPASNKGRAATLDRVARSPLQRMSRSSKAPTPAAVGGASPPSTPATPVAPTTGSAGAVGVGATAASPRKIPPPPLVPPLPPDRGTVTPPKRSTAAGALFGVKLSSACRVQPETGVVLLPSLVRQCWKYVERFAADAPSVYCVVTSNIAAVDKLHALFDSGDKVVLDQEVDGVSDAVNVVATLLKRYLTMLPEPVFTAALLPEFESTVRRSSTPESRAHALSLLVFLLPVELRTFLLHFISHLRTVVKHELVSADRLMAEFATCLRCSRDLLTAIYNNRRTILQPACAACAKHIGLAETPSVDTGEIVCSQCAGPAQ